jgi:hypothetical protein
MAGAPLLLGQNQPDERAIPPHEKKNIQPPIDQNAHQAALPKTPTSNKTALHESANDSAAFPYQCSIRIRQCQENTIRQEQHELDEEEEEFQFTAAARRINRPHPE